MPYPAMAAMTNVPSRVTMPEGAQVGTWNTKAARYAAISAMKSMETNTYLRWCASMPKTSHRLQSCGENGIPGYNVVATDNAVMPMPQHAGSQYMPMLMLASTQANIRLAID
ncbi:hypothetical protein GCM10008915_30660 [Bifidobacterium pullorum subsp. gallinarum]